MRGFVRSAGVILLANLGAVLLALTSPTSSALAATVLTIEPINLGVSNLTPRQLQGSLCNAPNTCEDVPYMAELSVFSIPGGAAALNGAIIATRASDPSGNIAVAGYSEGAQVANRWLNDYGRAPDAPLNLSVVLIGNPCRKYGGYTTPVGQFLGLVTPPDTQYQVVDVARQYDGWADAPTNPFNLLASVNAVAGALLTHTDYTNVDLHDPNNVTWQEGNITYVLVPTRIVPLLYPYQAWAQSPLGQLLGWNTLLESVNAQLKPIIDSAYVRPVPISSATSFSVADTQSSTRVALVDSALSSPGAAVASTPDDSVNTPEEQLQSQDSVSAGTPQTANATAETNNTGETSEASETHTIGETNATGEISAAGAIDGTHRAGASMATSETSGAATTVETSAASEIIQTGAGAIAGSTGSSGATGTSATDGRNGTRKISGPSGNRETTPFIGTNVTAGTSNSGTGDTSGTSVTGGISAATGETGGETGADGSAQ